MARSVPPRAQTDRTPGGVLLITEAGDRQAAQEAAAESGDSTQGHRKGGTVAQGIRLMGIRQHGINPRPHAAYFITRTHGGGGELMQLPARLETGGRRA